MPEVTLPGGGSITPPLTVTDLGWTRTTTKNAGIVTLTGSASEILTLSLSDLVTGGWLYLWFMAHTTKGGSGGYSLVRMFQSGGAGSIAFMQDATQASMNEPNVNANFQWHAKHSLLAIVDGDGDVDIEVEGESGGSNSTIAAGAAQMVGLYVPP